MIRALSICLWPLVMLALPLLAEDKLGATLPGTEPLTWEGDLAARMLDGVDLLLTRELESSAARRAARWKPDYSSPAAYADSLSDHREQLAAMLGLRDPRAQVTELQYVASTRQPALVGRGSTFDIYAVRWAAFGDVTGEGLWLQPRESDQEVLADVIVVPDAEQSPESLVGLVEGTPAESQIARRLAESGCRVLVPALIDRSVALRSGRAQTTAREYVYRSAYVLGRHMIGYELQKIFAAADWLCSAPAGSAAQATDQPAVRPLGIIGWGEGGMLALYAGALDPRFSLVGVSGYFAPRETLWQQPIDRNVFGLLELAGDAELAAMVAPRTLVIEACRSPEAKHAANGSAPYRLVTPAITAVEAEYARLEQLVRPLGNATRIALVRSDNGAGPCGTDELLRHCLTSLGSGNLAPSSPAPESLLAIDPDPARQQRQLHELDRHNQRLIVESPYERQKFMSGLDTRSLEAYQKSVEPYREHFRSELIGHFPYERLPLAPRSRKVYERETWTGYEVVLDVLPDVFAYGILLLPKSITPGERRPVVVCQHGLEGRPVDVVTGDSPFYHDYAAKLAERGYITFAPQNLYLLGEKFRRLQRKANPVKKSLFSVMVPQHHQIVAWLKTLPQVDAERIGFYGLSYGGVSAMRIPPLIPEYRLSICSANFNDWVVKTASSRVPYGYVGTEDYEIIEFNLGGTFNYAEMAALIAPRPFMVERGHFDGVGTDDVVASEFAKVRYLYQAQLKLMDHCEIEWFAGQHEIHGQGTFEFLDKHLRGPSIRAD